jgi:hypothetical protein
VGREAGGGVSFAMLVMLDWMGRSGYFNLGNSNSLASIDISKAYTGLTDYYPPVVGTFTLLITFTAPLLFVRCTGLRDFFPGGFGASEVAIEGFGPSPFRVPLLYVCCPLPYHV